MESPTDNVLQGSVRARSGSPARRRNTGAQGKARTPSSIPNSYRDSFFPLAIVQWNALPSSVACQASLPLFQADLSSQS